MAWSEPPSAHLSGPVVDQRPVAVAAAICMCLAESFLTCLLVHCGREREAGSESGTYHRQAAGRRKTSENSQSKKPGSKASSGPRVGPSEKRRAQREHSSRACHKRRNFLISNNVYVLCFILDYIKRHALYFLLYSK